MAVSVGASTAAASAGAAGTVSEYPSGKCPFSAPLKGQVGVPIPREMAARYSAETPVLGWRERLVCSRCGSRALVWW